MVYTNSFYRPYLTQNRKEFERNKYKNISFEDGLILSKNNPHFDIYDIHQYCSELYNVFEEFEKYPKKTKKQIDTTRKKLLNELNEMLHEGDIHLFNIPYYFHLKESENSSTKLAPILCKEGISRILSLEEVSQNTDISYEIYDDIYEELIKNPGHYRKSKITNGSGKILKKNYIPINFYFEVRDYNHIENSAKIQEGDFPVYHLFKEELETIPFKGFKNLWDSEQTHYKSCKECQSQVKSIREKHYSKILNNIDELLDSGNFTANYFLKTKMVKNLLNGQGFRKNDSLFQTYITELKDLIQEEFF